MIHTMIFLLHYTRQKYNNTKEFLLNMLDIVMTGSNYYTKKLLHLYNLFYHYNTKALLCCKYMLDMFLTGNKLFHNLFCTNFLLLLYNFLNHNNSIIERKNKQDRKLNNKNKFQCQCTTVLLHQYILFEYNNSHIVKMNIQGMKMSNKNKIQCQCTTVLLLQYILFEYNNSNIVKNCKQGMNIMSNNYYTNNLLLLYNLLNHNNYILEMKNMLDKQKTDKMHILLNMCTSFLLQIHNLPGYNSIIELSCNLEVFQ